jgi:hypothetical protein
MMSAVQATPSRHKLNGLAGFALASLALIVAAAAGLTLLFRGEGEARAVWISAAVAFLTQVIAFPAVRRLTRTNLIVGWGTGTLIRFGTLGAYALVAALVLHLPMTPALVGLAVFYFLSIVIEPLFLRS